MPRPAVMCSTWPDRCTCGRVRAPASKWTAATAGLSPNGLVRGWTRATPWKWGWYSAGSSPLPRSIVSNSIAGTLRPVEADAQHLSELEPGATAEAP
jgi:hypothetical protein